MTMRSEEYKKPVKQPSIGERIVAAVKQGEMAYPQMYARFSDTAKTTIRRTCADLLAKGLIRRSSSIAQSYTWQYVEHMALEIRQIKPVTNKKHALVPGRLEVIKEAAQSRERISLPESRPPSSNHFTF